MMFLFLNILQIYNIVSVFGECFWTLFCDFQSSEELSNFLYHPADYKEPILFSFRAKNFFGKKKASIRVGNGEWSEKFSLDIPGSSGVVVCKTSGTVYQVNF